MRRFHYIEVVVLLQMAAGLFFLSSARQASGQVELALSIEPVRALVYEPVNAMVVLRNNTGTVLNFDASRNAPKVFFAVERVQHEAVKALDRSPLMSGVVLVPAGSVTNAFNLTKLFAMQTRGVYKIRACLDWHDTLFASPQVEVEVLNGFEMARVIAGVPGEPDGMRVYILEYLTKEKGECVYLRIEDERSKTIYGMHKLGHIVRIHRPEMKIDEAGNVHVLFHTMSMAFVHTAFTPYGVHLFSKNYTGRQNAVSLQNMPNGQVSIYPQRTGETIDKGTEPAPGAQPAENPAPGNKRLGRGGLFGQKPE